MVDDNQNKAATQALGQMILPSSSKALLADLQELSQSLDNILADIYKVVGELSLEQKQTAAAEMSTALNSPTNTTRSVEMHRMLEHIAGTLKDMTEINDQQKKLFTEINKVRLMGSVTTPTTEAVPANNIQQVQKELEHLIKGLEDMRLHAMQAATLSITVPTTSSDRNTAQLGNMLEKLISTSQELIQKNRELKENMMNQAENIAKRPGMRGTG